MATSTTLTLSFSHFHSILCLAQDNPEKIESKVNPMLYITNGRHIYKADVGYLRRHWLWWKRMRRVRRREKRIQRGQLRRRTLTLLRFRPPSVFPITKRVAFKPPLVEVDEEYQTANGSAVFSAVAARCQLRKVYWEDGPTTIRCSIHEKEPFDWEPDMIMHDTPTLPPGSPLPLDPPGFECSW